MVKAKFQRKRKGGKRASKNPLSAKKRSHNQEVYKQTILVSSLITPAQGGATSNYLNMFCSPIIGQGAGNISAALLYNAEYALYCQMYDQVRVHSIRVRIVPRPSVTEAVALMINSGNQVPATNTITVGKNVYYSVEDRDGIATDPVASIAAMKRVSSCKVHRMDRPSTRSYRVKNTGDQWFDCQNRNSLAEVQKAIGMWGGLTYYGESFPENLNQTINGVWADLEVTYYLSFRGKAMVNIQVDENTGSVSVGTVVIGEQPAVQVFKQHDEIEHFGSIDLSGATIGLDVFEP